MAAQSVAGSPKVSRPITLKIGIVVLVLGLFGVAAWGVVAWWSSDYGSVAGESVAGQIAEVGYDDPQGSPDIMTGRDVDGNVVWTGTEEEYAALLDEGGAENQANIRETWLYPSLGVLGVGLVLVTVGVIQYRKRGADSTA